MNSHLALLNHGSSVRPRAPRAQDRRNARAEVAACRRAVLVAVCLAAGAAGRAAASHLPVSGWRDLIAGNEPVIFSVTGDIPYGTSEIQVFQQQIDQHDLYSPSAFLVHVGDILSGSESCSETRYRTVADILKSSAVPCFIVPGDNETTDCSNPQQGFAYWTQYLLGIDQNWACTPPVERQSGRQENFAFLLNGMLFLGINLVGGSNSNAIQQDDANWVSQQLQGKQSLVRGAVIFAQAGPGSGRDLFVSQFNPAATAFAKPILYIHGDGHSWKMDRPFSASNVLRVQVDNGSAELPVQVTATLDATNLFQFLRNPWNSSSAPIQRPPCGSPVPNAIPVALDDAYGVDEDGTLSVSAPGVLANDTDSDGDALTASVQTGPAHGTLTLNANGSFTYRPAANFNGADSFVYRASDGRGGTDTGTAALTVRPVNDAPVGVADAYTASVGTVLSVPAPGVLGNDSEVDGQTLTALLVTATANGGINLAANGAFTYTPNAGFTGSDSFTYRASDGSLQSALTTVALTVSGPTSTLTLAPAADAQVNSSSPTSNYGTSSELRAKTDATTYRSYLRFTVTGASGVQRATLRLYVTDPSPSGGSIHAVANTYAGSTTVWTETGLTWNNAPPITTPALAAAAAAANATWVEFEVTAAVPGDGTYCFGLQSGSNDSVRYSSRQGSNPPQLVLVTGTSGGGNTPPVAADDSYTASEDAALAVSAPGVLGNDQDADGDALAAAVVTAPAHGSLALAAGGAFTYTPQANFSGADGFTYRASDGRGGSDTAVVSIAITPVNDVPVAAPDAYTAPAGGLLSVAAPGVLGNDADADGDALTAVLTASPANGVLSLNADGAFTYAPNPSFSGSDAFRYRARDDSTESAEVQVTLTVSTSPAAVTFQEVQSGGSSGVTTVSTTAAIAGAAGDVYLAAIASKPYQGVTALSGLGLPWTRVRAQCAGRSQTGVEVWLGRGTASTGTVTATLASAPNAAVIAVSRYAGADATNPIAGVASANSNGVNGTCSGGTDSPGYAIDLSVPTGGGTVFGAVAMRNRDNVPGAGYAERAEVHQGTSGSEGSVAVMDRTASAGTARVDGTFASAVDWAAIGLVLRPGGATAKLQVADEVAAVPLYRVFPNPARQGTSILYDLAVVTPVEAVIYNVAGRRVRMLLSGTQSPGRQLLQWDARDDAGRLVPSGVYFVHLHVGTRRLDRKLILQR